jgi:hypothetical protein
MERDVQSLATMALIKRRLILGVLALLLPAVLYRVFAVYTIRSGECRPRPVDPSLRLLTRDEHGTLVSFPERTGAAPASRRDDLQHRGP